MSFTLWKNEDEDRAAAYNCRLHDNEEFTRQYGVHCYTVQDEFQIPVPVAGPNGQLTKREIRTLNKEAFLKEVVKLHDFFNGDMTMWEVMLKFFRGVCPMAYFDHDIDTYVRLESAASAYNALPYEGGYLQQPNIILEAFDVIRGTRAQFEHKLHQKARREEKKAQKSSNSKGR